MMLARARRPQPVVFVGESQAIMRFGSFESMGFCRVATVL